MEMTDGRGILYPTRLPTFHREPAPENVAPLARWFWVPRWQLAAGRTSRQQLLPFPASNLVIQPDSITISGPTSRASHRDLTGTGWAVGALLRPAGVAALGLHPPALRDREVPFAADDLHEEIVEAMADSDEVAGRTRALAVFVRWLVALDAPDDSALLANTMEDLIASDRTLMRVEQVAQRLHLSVRGLQRLAERHVGLPPLAIIRRYRLQEAAQRLRSDPAVTIADVAAELGYADHAHLTADFRTVLGLSPRAYRSDATPGGVTQALPTN